MNSVMPQTHHTANFKTRQSQDISTGDTELPRISGHLTPDILEPLNIKSIRKDKNQRHEFYKSPAHHTARF